MKLYWFLLFTVFSSSGFSKVKICHLSNNYRFGDFNKKLNNHRVNGLNMAYEDFLNSKKNNNENIVFKYINTKKDTSLLEHLELARNDNCNIIIGLHTSKAALIAGPWLVKNKILGISATATATRTDKYFPFLLSSMAPSTAFVKRMVEAIKKENNRKIIFINFKDDIYSNIITSELKKEMDSEYITKTISVNSSSTLNDSQFTDLISTSHASVIFTGFFFPTFPILNQLSKHKEFLKENFFLGSPEWSFSSEFRKFQNRLVDYKNLYTTSVWDINHLSSKSKKIVKKYFKTYKAQITQKTAFIYDTLMMTLNCSQSRDGNISRTYKCLLRKRDYSGITGKYHFSGSSSHSYKLIHMLKVPIRMKEI